MPRPLLAVLLLSATPAWAEVPTVLADTAPLHSLVAQVMGDLGEPALIVPPGTSPHDASLTPSEAQALSKADLVVWTGPALVPWLAEALPSLAPQARGLPLLESGGWEPLPARAGAALDETGEGLDPHAWLDPAVASAWLGLIAEELGALDPANAETYATNAEQAADRLKALAEETRTRLAPLAGRGYAVGHDAYQYFERASGLPAAWTITPSDDSEPSPTDIAALREAVVVGDVTCLLLDPETDPAWADTLGEGTALRTATADPEGLALTPGPDLYPTLIESLADALESCLHE